MKIVIWCKSLENGKEQLNQIILNYQRIGVEIELQRNSKNEVSVEFKNGDYIRVIPARESMRGVKCNISIVERSIEQEFFDCIIKSCTILPPFYAFKFFGEGELIL